MVTRLHSARGLVDGWVATAPEWAAIKRGLPDWAGGHAARARAPRRWSAAAGLRSRWWCGPKPLSARARLPQVLGAYTTPGERGPRWQEIHTALSCFNRRNENLKSSGLRILPGNLPLVLSDPCFAAGGALRRPIACCLAGPSGCPSGLLRRLPRRDARRISAPLLDRAMCAKGHGGARRPCARRNWNVAESAGSGNG